MQSEKDELVITRAYVKGTQNIPVCWENSAYNIPNPTKAVTIRNWVRTALADTWEAESALSFQFFGACPSAPTQFNGMRIIFNATATGWGRPAPNPSASMGEFEVATMPTGTCLASPTNEKLCIQFNAVHEMGHALSFRHETERVDGNAPTTFGEGTTYVGEDPDAVSAMGVRYPWTGGFGISRFDIEGVQRYYGSPRENAVIPMGNNVSQGFFRGPDGDLFTVFYNGGAILGGPTQIAVGTKIASAPAAVSWGPGRMDVFARGMNGELLHFWYQGSWSGPEVIGPAATIVGQPAVTSWGSGRLDVFARGVDGVMKHYWYPGGWGPESLGGQITGTPSAVSWGAGRLDIFARGHDEKLQHVFYSNQSWGSDTWQGPPIGGSPSAVTWGPNRIDVFARNAPDNVNNNKLIHYWWDGTFGAGSELLGSTLVTGNPSAVTWGPNRLDVFARTENGSLGHWWYPGGFYAPEIVSGQSTVVGSPAAASWSGDNVHALFRNPAGYSSLRSHTGSSVWSVYSSNPWPDRCKPFNTATPSADFCLSAPYCPCYLGEGDCDNGQCAAPLVCNQSVGAKYGLPANYDVCERPSTCPTLNPSNPWFFCTAACPCGVGEGHCANDDVCSGDLVCRPLFGAFYGLPANASVCVRP